MSATAQQVAAPTLASRPLPKRVRQLLEGIMEYASGELERGLHAMLNEYEAQLFKFAEQARNHLVQTRWLEAQRLVKRTRPDLIPRFLIALEAELAVVREPTVATRVRVTSEELSLMDDLSLDESTVVTEIASRAELRNSLPLYLLGQRFGVLAGKPALDADALPIGPQALCRMIRTASECLELSNEHRLLLLRNFDRQVMPMYGDLVESTNSYLAKHGVLPNLHYIPVRVRRVSPVSEPASPPKPGDEPARADGDNRGRTGEDNQGAPTARPGLAGTMPSREGSNPPVSLANQPGNFFYTGGAGAGHGMSAGSESGTYGEDVGQGGQARSKGGGYAGSGGTGRSAPSDFGSGPAADVLASEGSLNYAEEGFQVLRRLLGGRRQLIDKLNPGKSAGPVDPTRTVSAPALQGALDQLQRRKATPMMVDGKAVHRSVNHIKQDMLALLRMGASEDAPPEISAEDGDTVDLIGMLFDNILKDVKPNSPAARLLSKLQVPLMRVALQDKQFFTQDLHPARQMLNAVAETGVFWINDEDADQTLVTKMNSVVDRTVQDFDGNLDLFRDLLEDIGTNLQTISRKAEVAERRHVEAARGREKLAVAREHASQTIEAMLKQHNLPRFTHTLLSQAWTDVMALAALRQGEDSPIWQQQIDIAQRLVLAAKPGGTAISREEADELRQEIENSLSQVGYHAEETKAIAARLVDPDSGSEDDAASRTELAMRLKARSRLGQDREMDSKRRRPLNAEELGRLEQIKQLPFGTWFEFVDETGDKSQRRRLSWFSTVTGHVLFVNQRGQKVSETSLESLAIDLAAGKVKLMITEKGSLIDRAWTGVMNALRTFSGQPSPGGAAS